MLEALSAAVARASTADWLLLSSGVLLALYVLGTWRYDFFKKRGIASTRPLVPFFGNTLKGFLTLTSLPALVQELYQKGKGHSVFGFFEFQRPIFMIRDPELLKLVTVKDFEHFPNHRSITTEADPIFSQNLFNLKDQRWKDMRTTLSPAFTTSKIKAMFHLIMEVTTQMAQHLREKHATVDKKGKTQPLEVDMKDLFSRVANDVIGTVAFGVGCDSQKEPMNEFYKMGKKLTTFSFRSVMIFLGYVIAPKLAGALGLRVLSEKATNYFDSLVHDTIRERQKRGIVRPDMLQLLMQARKGELRADASEEHETEKLTHSKIDLSDTDITAQAVIFFFAGFETVSTALCFTSYALSKHPDVQERLQQEIDDMMRETGGKPTYEAIQGMKYLDAVISESLRLYPPVVSVDRVCQEDMVLPPTDKSGPTHIRKGDIVWVPTFGLHRDPEHWPEPEMFDPERFSDENKHNIKHFTYAPFGLGPRLCIGQRFALLEVKLALVILLANFDLSLSPKVKEPLQFERGFNMMIRGGFWSLLTPRSV